MSKGNYTENKCITRKVTLILMSWDGEASLSCQPKKELLAESSISNVCLLISIQSLGKMCLMLSFNKSQTLCSWRYFFFLSFFPPILGGAVVHPQSVYHWLKTLKATLWWVFSNPTMAVSESLFTIRSLVTVRLSPPAGLAKNYITLIAYPAPSRKNTPVRSLTRLLAFFLFLNSSVLFGFFGASVIPTI